MPAAQQGPFRWCAQTRLATTGVSAYRPNGSAQGQQATGLAPIRSLLQATVTVLPWAPRPSISEDTSLVDRVGPQGRVGLCRSKKGSTTGVIPSPSRRSAQGTALLFPRPACCPACLHPLLPRERLLQIPEPGLHTMSCSPALP